MSLREMVFFVATLFVVAGVGVEGTPIKDLKQGKSPYLWRINSSPPSYLFGTLHVPYTLVWDSVSDDAKTAFNSSNQVYLEFEHQPTAGSAATCSSLMLPPNQTLDQVRHFKEYDMLTIKKCEGRS